MKINPIFGKGTGKVGGLVFANVSGEQIIREYNGNVSNPNTEAQVGQRAKFKLASQLAATLNDNIVIPKKGLISARNQFVKKNIGHITVSEDTASVDYEKLQISDGTIRLPEVEGATVSAQEMQVQLAEDASALVDRVAYVVYKKVEDGTLQFVASKVVTTPGTSGDFRTNFPFDGNECVVYAYGMKDKNAAARTKYENYNVQSGTNIASLVASRTFTTAEYSFSVTVGCTVESMG